MPDEPASGVRIGMGDVTRLRATVDLFSSLDGRFGGGHVRESLIKYLSVDADRLLRGRYSADVGQELFSAVGEATLLAAWMTYECACLPVPEARLPAPGASSLRLLVKPWKCGTVLMPYPPARPVPVRAL